MIVTFTGKLHHFIVPKYGQTTPHGRLNTPSWQLHANVCLPIALQVHTD